MPSLSAHDQSSADTNAKCSQSGVTGLEVMTTAITKSAKAADFPHAMQNPGGFPFPLLSEIPSVVENAQGHGRCHYNSLMYACTHSGPAVGPRVFHIDCDGVPIGQVGCNNMSLHPKWTFVDDKCSKCLQEDDFMAQSKQLAEVIEADKKRNSLENGYSKWNLMNKRATSTFEPLLSREDKQKIELQRYLAVEKAKNDAATAYYRAKALVKVQNARSREASRMEGKLGKESGPEHFVQENSAESRMGLCHPKRTSTEQQENALRSSAVVRAITKKQAENEAAAASPNVKGRPPTTFGNSLFERVVKSWRTPLKEESNIESETESDEWEEIDSAVEDDWLEVSAKKIPEGRPARVGG